MTTKGLTMLDCFCGMGGVLDGFALEGFNITGIDIEDAPKKLGYKHSFYQADLKEISVHVLKYKFPNVDVIWGSPPCRDFTKLPDHGKMKTGQHFKWKIPKDPQRGLRTVQKFLKIVEYMQPKIWILENVSGLADYLGLKPFAVDAKIWGGKRHVFYSNLKPFLIPTCKRTKVHEKYGGPLRSWERAKIPLSCSQTFAKACKEELLEAVCIS